MGRTFRSALVVLIAFTMVIDPATACHFCGGYQSGYSPYMGGYESGWYESDGSCCGGEVVVESGCYGCGGCDNCGGCSACGGGCSNCGGGCDGCDGAVSDDGPGPAVLQPAPEMAPMTPPEPPIQQRMPSNVNKPMDEMAPPSLPPTPRDTGSESRVMPPQQEPAMSPMEEPTDDLFGAPPQPAETKPADDDMFGPPPTDTSRPAETDDFFNEPSAEPSAPAEEPSEPAAPAQDEPMEDSGTPSTDDLFGTPPTDTAPPAEEEESAPADEETDDLFGDAGATLNEPGGLASIELREWVDNTGQYSCRARLLRMLDGKVQLLKDNGRTATVELNRLGRSELEFVNRQASAQRAESLGQTAQLAPAR